MVRGLLTFLQIGQQAPAPPGKPRENDQSPVSHPLLPGEAALKPSLHSACFIGYL